MSDASSLPSPSPWIVSQRFDVLWFFGGTLLSLLVLGLNAAGVSMALLFWGWILLVDGPHIAATLTRTYVDSSELRARPKLMWVALVVSALVGPLCLILDVILGRPGLFLLFLGGATLYAYHHVVRQHWGFLALYRAKGAEREGIAVDRWCLYVGCWAPYVYLLLIHPRARPVLGLPAEVGALELAGAWGLVALTVGALGVFLVHNLRRSERPNPAKVAYVVATLVLYGCCYFFVSRAEPVYAAAKGPDQDFMLITVMISGVHGWQYVGLVWFHNKNRYAREGSFGAAGWLGGRWWRYGLGLGLFSLTLYLASAALTGVFPALAPFATAKLGPVSVNELGLALWWGIAIHHYVIDQNIWRVSKDPQLSADLHLTRA
jgi:hypothetical protein